MIATNQIQMNRILYLMLTLVLIGCGQTDKFDMAMNRADSIMEARQDGAKISLAMLDSLQPQLTEMSEAQRMRYHLLQAKAMNKGYVEFTSDSTMKEVAEYYNRHGSDREKMTANYLLGCVYRDLGDAPTAMKYLNEATSYEEANKTSYRVLAHIHGEMAYLLEEQTLVDNVITELDIARHNALLAGDTVEAITILSLKAPTYQLNHKTDSAELIVDSCINMFIASGHRQYAAQISAYGLRDLVRQGYLDKARERIAMYENESGYFHDGEIVAGKEIYYQIKGLYFLSVGETDSAEVMFRKCLKYKDDLNTLNGGYRGMSLLYDKIGPADSTAKYAMLAYEANDSSYQKDVAEKLISQQALYNYSKHQEAALASARQTAALQRWLFGTFAILAALVCATLFIYRRKKRAVQKRIAMMQERYETEKTLLQREMEAMNALLEERQSLLESKENQLERREAELMEQREQSQKSWNSAESRWKSSVAQLNIEIGKREQSIAELQQRVAEYERDMNIKDIAALEDEIQHAPVKDDFAHYLKNVTEQPSAKDWDRLMRFAKSHLPKLYVMLRNYNVTERELRICLLTRLMFKPKDIAVLVGCRFPEVSLTRSRLLKKIYGIDGKASDFDKRIMLMY